MPDRTGEQVSPPVCALCGAVAPGPVVPLTWSTSVEDGRRLVHCERCVRVHVRAMEGKLDSAWW